MEKLHQAVVNCLAAMQWLSNVMPCWQQDKAEFQNDPVLSEENLLVGLKNSIGVLKENYLICADPDNKKLIQSFWTPAATGVIQACGESGCSAHYLVAVLAEKSLKEVGFATHSAIYAKDVTPDCITAESLDKVTTRLQFLDEKQLEYVCQGIVREGVLVGKTPGNTDANENILEILNDKLSKKQYIIVKHLWDRSHGANYNHLRYDIPDAWQDVPTDEAIEKALKRIVSRLNENPELGVTIEISTSKQRVKLNRPQDK
jgi:hypothetical protein